MSEPVSPLQGARFDGFAQIREIGPVGMITLRAKGLKSLDKAVKAAVGTKVPGQRRIEVNAARACAWMSPDEYLLILPYAEVATALTGLAKSLQGQHYLAVDVSDARAIFRIEGDNADQVLRKLSPADINQLAPGELRRSRIAQTPAAFWRQGAGITLICFRSVAAYVMGIMTHAAQPGSELP